MQAISRQDMKNLFKSTGVLIAIIFLGFILRIYKVDSIPGSLNPDEVALGYNAYSILKTGADEHGRLFPLAIQSFGDWKLPVYPYFDVIPMTLLGLNASMNAILVRLPSIAAGVIGIILVYAISFLLFKKKAISLFVALSFALNPWSIYFSRIAYEANVATTLFLGGLLSFLYAIKIKNSKFFILSSILFGMTLFTYHSFIIIVPLFVIGTVLLYRKQISLNKWTALSGIILVLFIFISYISTLGGGVKKFNTTTIFNNKNIIYERVERFRGDGQDSNVFINQFLHNKFLGVSYQISLNYLNSFSPTFLFDKGGEKLLHNLPGFGNLYIIDVLFVLIGLAGIFWNREKIGVLFLWLCIAPIPSSLTLDSPNTTRLFAMMPILVVFSGYGMYMIYSFVKRKRGIYYGIGILVVALFLLNIFYFLNIYFLHFNYHRERFWHYGYKELVDISNQYKDHKLVMSGPENFPYIYFLFYNKYDPVRFRTEVEYYPPTDEGFYYVKKFGRYEFLPDLNNRDSGKNTLYIEGKNFHESDSLIKLHNGDPIFRYYIK